LLTLHRDGNDDITRVEIWLISFWIEILSYNLD
jgi:hypothetical protein